MKSLMFWRAAQLASAIAVWALMPLSLLLVALAKRARKWEDRAQIEVFHALARSKVARARSLRGSR